MARTEYKDHQRVYVVAHTGTRDCFYVKVLNFCRSSTKASWAGGNDIFYNPVEEFGELYSYPLGSKLIYLTRKDAQKECDRRNRKL